MGTRTGSHRLTGVAGLLALVLCSDKAVYLAGPLRERLVAVSTDDGRCLNTLEDGRVLCLAADH